MIISAGKFSIPVLFVDNHVLVVEKPANMPVQRDASGDDDLLSACKQFIASAYNKPGEAYLGLVHRLDRPVGGAMVLARTSKAAARLSKAFADHTVDKAYLAVLRGELTQPVELEDYLLKDERSGMVSVVPEGTTGGKLARLLSEPIMQQNGLTLAKVTLYTGRAHQIRVQHAHAGYPLWGDARYGGGKPGEQIALWAHELGFVHPTLREHMRFQSDPPTDGAFGFFNEGGWSIEQR